MVIDEATDGAGAEGSISMRRLGIPPLACAASLLSAATPAGGVSQHWLPSGGRYPTTDGVVHSFPLPHAVSGPTTVVVAADGRIWFTEGTGDRIGRVEPDGSGLVEFALPHAGSAPRILARGGDGNLWFSEHLGNRIGRITPQGLITEFSIPTPASQPRAIALGADGNIWFGEFAGGKIGRISPTGEITEFELPTSNSGPRALAAGPDGNIWYSAFHANKVGRITMRGKITEYSLPRPDSGPGDITAGPDGAMWLVELSGGMDGVATDGNRVARVSLTGEITEFVMPSTTPSPINIAVGPDRNLWYTQGAQVVRVTPSGTMTEFPAGVGARIVGLSAGSDREPPGRLVNRLYFADGAQDRICYLEFRPAARRGGTPPGPG